MSRFSSSNHRASKVPLANGSPSGIGRPNRSTGSAPDTHRSTSRVSAARRSVSGLSDRGLLNATARLVKTERLTTLEILVHLNEVEKRELYLTLGCGSMFEYCVNQLGYSRSAAWRRIHSARCLGQFPEVCTLVEKNELSLSTLFLIAGTLTRDNKTALLEHVRGKTEIEVQKILAAYKPPATYRDRVKPVRVAVPTPKSLAPREHTQSSAPAGLGLNAAHRTAGGSHTAERSGPGEASNNDGPAKESGTISTGTAGGPSTRCYTLETQLLIQFVAGEAFMGKYHEARSLLSNKLTEISFATVFEATLDAFLDKHSPARKQARRETRVAVKKRATQKDQTKRTPEPKTQQRKPAARADQLSRKKFDGRTAPAPMLC